jgi:hypothetical protein
MLTLNVKTSGTCGTDAPNFSAWHSTKIPCLHHSEPFMKVKFYLRAPEMLLISTSKVGRAIAQAVSRWLPTAAARVRARVWSSGICGGQSGAGAGFPILRHSSNSLVSIVTELFPTSHTAL